MRSNREDYWAWQRRRRRIRLAQAILLWSGLVLLCLATLFGVWSFFVLLLSFGGYR